MTVQDLIAILGTFAPDTEVLMGDYNSPTGFVDIAISPEPHIGTGRERAIIRPADDETFDD
jgi:hypothetical protein